MTCVVCDEYGVLSRACLQKDRYKHLTPSMAYNAQQWGDITFISYQLCQSCNELYNETGRTAKELYFERRMRLFANKPFERKEVEPALPYNHNWVSRNWVENVLPNLEAGKTLEQKEELNKLYGPLAKPLSIEDKVVELFPEMRFDLSSIRPVEKPLKGLYDYKVVCDENNNSVEDRNNRMLRVDLYMNEGVSEAEMNFDLSGYTTRYEV